MQKQKKPCRKKRESWIVIFLQFYNLSLMIPFLLFDCGKILLINFWYCFQAKVLPHHLREKKIEYYSILGKQ